VALAAVYQTAIDGYAVIGPELGKAENSAARNVRLVIIPEMLPNPAAFVGLDPALHHSRGRPSWGRWP
jgi:hypothetical protein